MPQDMTVIRTEPKAKPGNSASPERRAEDRKAMKAHADVVRGLMKRVPVSAEDVLEMFAEYVAAVPEPLNRATNIMHDEMGYVECDVYGLVCGISHDAPRLGNRLEELRRARAAAPAVTLCLQAAEAKRLEFSLGELLNTLAQSASALQLIAETMDTDEGGTASAKLAGVAHLMRRALIDAEEQEGKNIREFVETLRRLV